MKNMMMKARKGATFIEYAMLAGLVAIVVAVAALFFGDELKKLFSATGEKTTVVTEGVRGANLEVDLSTPGSSTTTP